MLLFKRRIEDESTHTPNNRYCLRGCHTYPSSGGQDFERYVLLFDEAL